MKILVVGDSYMTAGFFEQAFGSLEREHEVEYLQITDRPFAPRTESESSLREFQGSPDEVAERVAAVEALVVHGAPVSAGVIEAAPELRLLCCARGGPVNVDVEALNARGVPLVNTPGKNAAAVADLTLAFLVMLARNLPQAQRFLDEGNELGDNFAGSSFIGLDLGGHTLGLVGYGQIGRRVAERALAFEMAVVAHDPFVEEFAAAEKLDTLDQLLERSDFVSLHLRATPETEAMIGPGAFAAMRPGAFLVNTARETLVDEEALDAALSSGRLAGAALDVFDPAGGPGRHRLLRHPNVVMTPHVGGATRETLLRGAKMIAEEIGEFAAGRPLRNVRNRDAIQSDVPR